MCHENILHSAPGKPLVTDTQQSEFTSFILVPRMAW